MASRTVCTPLARASALNCCSVLFLQPIFGQVGKHIRRLLTELFQALRIGGKCLYQIKPEHPMTEVRFQLCPLRRCITPNPCSIQRLRTSTLPTEYPAPKEQMHARITGSQVAHGICGRR